MLGLPEQFVDSELAKTISSPLAPFSRLRWYRDEHGRQTWVYFCWSDLGQKIVCKNTATGHVEAGVLRGRPLQYLLADPNRPDAVATGPKRYPLTDDLAECYEHWQRMYATVSTCEHRLGSVSTCEHCRSCSERSAISR